MPSSIPRLLLIAAALTVAIPTASASAATITMVTNGDWGTASNWSPAQVPGIDDDVVLGAHLVTVSDPRSAKSLSMNGAEIQGSGGLTVTTSATVHGNLSGPVTFGPNSTVTLSCQCGIGATVAFQGNTTFVTGTMFTGAGAALVNTGTFTVTGGHTIDSGTFINAAGGLIQKTAGGSVQLAMSMTNHGTIHSQSGTLYLGTVAGEGDYLIDEAATLRGSIAFGSQSSVTGPGTLWMSFGSAADGATIDVGQLTIDQPVTLDTTTPAAKAALLNLSGGTRAGSGTLEISAGGTVAGNFEDGITTFGPASNVTVNCQCSNGGDSVVNFNGTTSRIGGTWFHGGTAVINNGGTFTFNSNGGWGSFNISGASFDNTGTLIRTAGTTGSNLPITSSGTIEVQSGGVLGGDITLTGGVLEGPGTLADSLTNAGGEIRPGASIGTLTVNGAFTMSGGVLEEEMQGTADGEFDRLAVGGAVSITGGDLKIDRLNGFTPAPADEFRFITSPSQPAGGFATITNAAVGDRSFQTRNDPTGVVAFLQVNPPAGGQPSIPASGLVGDPFTCQPGTWSPVPDTIGYEWLRDGTISVGTGDEYTPVPADAGHTVICRVTATNAAGGNAADSNAATVSKRTQTITFGAPSDRVVGDADVDPGATASSGLPVGYASSTPDVCTIIDGKVHLVAAGTCTVVASQAGDGTYSPAGDVARSFAVAAPAVVVTPTPTPTATSTPAPAAPRPVTVPVTQIAVLPPKKACVSRRKFRIHFRTPRGEKLASARVLVNGKQVAVRRGLRLSAPVDLRGLPKGRFTVRIEVTTASGKVLRGTRKYRTCVPKRRS